MRLAARSTVIAGALVIAAITASEATARLFDPDPHQWFYVNPSTGYATPVPTPQTRTTAPRPEVHANPDQQATQTGRVSPAPPNQARGSRVAAINRAKEQALANHVPPTGRYHKADLNTHATTVHPIATAAPTLKSTSNGFDWGDAAIGAGITAAIALVLTAGSLAVRGRSQPRHP